VSISEGHLNVLMAEQFLHSALPRLQRQSNQKVQLFTWYNNWGDVSGLYWLFSPPLRIKVEHNIAEVDLQNLGEYHSKLFDVLVCCQEERKMIVKMMMAFFISKTLFSYCTFPIGNACPLMDMVGYWAFLKIFSARTGTSLST